jgi:hypothetical protein
MTPNHVRSFVKSFVVLSEKELSNGCVVIIHQHWRSADCTPALSTVHFFDDPDHIQVFVRRISHPSICSWVAFQRLHDSST